VWVTQPYYPDIQSTSHLLTGLLEAMGGDPVEFTVICGHPVLVSEGTPARAASCEQRGNVRIFRCGLRSDYKRNLLLRFLYMASFVLAASWRLVRVSRGALVFAVTNPPFAPVWIGALSRIFGFRYHIVCHDVFPDGLVALGKLPEPGLVADLWHRANRVALRDAKTTVVLGRDMLELLRDRYGVPEAKLKLIPHWSVNDGGGRFAPEETRLWRTLGFTDAFVVQYSGNMGLWHDIETLVRAAAILKDHDRIRFVFLGGGMRKEKARALESELGVARIDWLPFQPEESLTDSLACAHLSIISQREGLEGIAVPCKLYGILASGRGILGLVPEGSEVARVIAEEDCGVRLGPHDPGALAAVILKLSEDLPRVREMGSGAYAAFDGKYRLEQAVKRYRELWD